MHVTTEVNAIGGHNRTIQNWSLNDPTSRHSLILIDQPDEKVPEWLIDPIRSSGGSLISFPVQASLLTKARWLREIGRSQADLIVLHHYGGDFVPTVAFAHHDCPPVAVLNYMDHLFWSGSSVADLVINLRSVGSRLCETRRYVRSNVTIPIPLSLPDAGISREDARGRLGIPMDQTVLISVGRTIKYQPSTTHNFFSTTRRILEQHRDAHLYLIGVSEADAARYGRDQVHPRLHPMGPVEDPSDYHAAADIYLEGFPFGSQTALLEAALVGIATVPAYDPPFELAVTNDDAISDLIVNPPDENTYIRRVNSLIDDNAMRRSLGAELRRRMLEGHTGSGWNRRVNEVYDMARGLRHRPRVIPCSDCIETETDVALCNWQTSLCWGSPHVNNVTKGLHETLYYIAYKARQSGDYRAAFEVLLRCCRRWPGNGSYLWALAKLVPHRIVRSIHQLKAGIS